MHLLRKCHDGKSYLLFLGLCVLLGLAWLSLAWLGFHILTWSLSQGNMKALAFRSDINIHLKFLDGLIRSGQPARTTSFWVRAVMACMVKAMGH